jgi:hypothetical protein
VVALSAVWHSGMRTHEAGELLFREDAFAGKHKPISAMRSIRRPFGRPAFIASQQALVLAR